MLLSYNLLKRYVNLEGISAFECADKLTECGIEVEEVIPVLQGTGLVSGYVEECMPHPDSDHLNLTKVNIGSEVLSIVCGASNIKQGQYVIVATVGAKLKDLEIKPTKIRGQESFGMICSLKELGLQDKFIKDEDKEGIKVLPKCELGMDPRIVLGLDDYSLDIKQTPNRSDFMSVFAIAYEVAALFKREVTIPEYKNMATDGGVSELIVTSNTDNCSYFIGKTINSIEVKDSVEWIRNALIGCGIKPINNVVDISNLVMLETGQPLHYYDKDFLATKEISVRDDFSGKVVGLDDVTYSLEEKDLVIFNQETPIGIAGIMGLGNSGIQPESTGLVIEAARFDLVRVRKTATRLGLSTDASIRFSKPYSVPATLDAVDRSVALLKEYANASDLEETVIFGENIYTPKEVQVTVEHVNKLLGTRFSSEEIMGVFNDLFFHPELEDGVITCSIPYYRLDIDIAEDLIEEVVRILGFSSLEDTLPLLDLTSGAYTKSQSDVRYIEEYLLGIGADQINTYTLVSKKQVSEDAISLLSPMSEARSVLRTSLLPSMLETIRYNQSYKIKDLFYFEISRIYTKTQKEDILAIAGSGNMYKNNWIHNSTAIDFYTLKGIIIEFLEGLGINEKRLEFKAEDVDTTLFHPFQSASIYLNRKKIGVLGAIHPSYAKEVGVKNVYYAEINLTESLNVKRATTKFKSINKNPSVIKDITVTIDPEYSSIDVAKIIQKAAGSLVQTIECVDIYTLDNKHRALTYQLALSSNKTLTDNEIHDVLDKVNLAITNTDGMSIR